MGITFFGLGFNALECVDGMNGLPCMVAPSGLTACLLPTRPF